MTVPSQTQNSSTASPPTAMRRRPRPWSGAMDRCAGASAGAWSTSRLARGKDLLRTRLTGRGLALSAGSLAIALSRDAASASVTAPLVAATVQTVMLMAAEQGPAAGVVSAHIAALAEGALKSLFL